MKKVFAMILALVFCLSLGMTAASAEGPVEISFWHAWGSGANYEALTKLVDDFNAAHEGEIHVTEQYIGNYAETLSKFNVSFKSGENPTVSIIDACMSLNELQYGTMINLSEYAAKNDPDYDIGQFVPAMLVFSTDTDGNVWSLPYGRSTQIMYGNMDLLGELGYGMPQSWEEMWEICEKWTEKTGKPAYGHPIAGGYFTFYITVWGGGEYFSKDGLGACMYLNDGWEKALTAWRNAIDKGWYEVPSLTTGGFWEDFMAGNLPFCFYSSGNLGGAITKTEGVFELGVDMLPGKLQDDGSIYRRVYTGGSNLMLSSNKSEEETKAGWEFIKFMTSTESNIYHSLKTGYVLSHVGVENDPRVQEAWAANPKARVAFDQLAYLNETHVSPYMSEIDNELVSSLEAFASDDISVEDEMANLKDIMESVLPNGIVETYE